MAAFDYPHRRYNPLTGEWLLVSPHRTQRPWLGQTEAEVVDQVPTYDPDCYLCPGNTRSSGQRNPDYTATFVFDNDFPALLSPKDPPTTDEMGEGFFMIQPEAGKCQVTCFSPRHDLSIAQLSEKQVIEIVRTWTEQTRQLGNLDYIAYVQVFENRGAMMGASNPHPHSQVWASEHIPNDTAIELKHQAEYLEKEGRCLLCSYLESERRRKERIVAENEGFTAMVPFWAVWPFEVMVIANKHQTGLPDLKASEQAALADMLRQITGKYDRLFQIPFPYSMGFHQAPVKGGPFPGMHLHAHYYPPLLRSASVRKFMVGYELLAQPQRDITPETAAERLRNT